MAAENKNTAKAFAQLPASVRVFIALVKELGFPIVVTLAVMLRLEPAMTAVAKVVDHSTVVIGQVQQQFLAATKQREEEHRNIVDALHAMAVEHQRIVDALITLERDRARR